MQEFSLNIPTKAIALIIVLTFTFLLSEIIRFNADFEILIFFFFIILPYTIITIKTIIKVIKEKYTSIKIDEKNKSFVLKDKNKQNKIINFCNIKTVRLEFKTLMMNAYEIGHVVIITNAGLTHDVTISCPENFLQNIPDELILNTVIKKSKFYKDPRQYD